MGKVKELGMERQQKEEKREITRCGYCGVFMINGVEIDHNILSAKEQKHQWPQGYCSNAQQEHYEQNPEDY